MFYCYKRQHLFTSLKYRLVLDGLWTADPLNPNKEYDESMNLYFSKVEDPGSIKVATKTTKNDSNFAKHQNALKKCFHMVLQSLKTFLNRRVYKCRIVQIKI